MKIGIHHRRGSFSEGWIRYCEINNIEYKIVNCYRNDIINQLRDCGAFMWHFHHANPRDTLFAKQLITSLQSAGKIVFPDYNTMWHFDDKVAQKYLLESIHAPIVQSYVFYDKKNANNWISKTTFPKVFKLRRGAGSAHVTLVKSKKHAYKLTARAFGKGFSQYNAIKNLRERIYKFRRGRSSIWNLVKGVARIFKTTEFNKVMGREKGYVYFQDFVNDCKYDYRVKVVDGKCWAFKRYVRDNDFRASGSGNLDFSCKNLPIEIVESALEITYLLKLQSVAFDYLIKDNRIFIVEMSYAFGIDKGEMDHGYWDSKLKRYSEKFDALGWMVESLLKREEY